MNHTTWKVYSDLFALGNFVQQTCVSQGKSLIIDALRENFKKDSFYAYRTDAFGFPLIRDMTDLPPDIGDPRTTRIAIGDIYPLQTRFYPSINVRYSSGRYIPVSFNQNLTTKYRVDLVVDGYGEQSLIKVPTHRVVAGAWDHTLEVIIATQSIPDREEITDIVAGFLMGQIRQELYEAGLFIRSISIGAEREEDYVNDKIYIQSITIECRGEFRRHIPLNSLIETINFCFNYKLFDGDSSGVTDSFALDLTESITI